MIETIQALDEALILSIQTLRGPVLTPLLSLLSIVGQGGGIWIFLSLLLMAGKRRPRAGVAILCTMALCYVFNDLILKELIARPRPFLSVPDLTVLLWRPGSYSFPSGHACSSFCCAYLMVRFYGKRAWPFYLLAALIAFSRPYVGVHYVSDILAGAAIGTLGGVIGYRLSSHWVEARV